MTLPVSTSGRDLPGRLADERGGGSVLRGVVGDAVEPATVDHADPGAGQDAHGVGVVFAAVAGVVVDLRGPGAGVAAFVSKGGAGASERFPGGPAGGLARELAG